VTLRRWAALALALAAAPALAYLLPPAAVLRLMGERRARLELTSLEVIGTLQLERAAAARLGPALRIGAPAPVVEVPARFQLKVPGRCRLELLPQNVAEAERPFLTVRDGNVSGRGGLESVPAAVALARSTCALLATSVAGDASDAYAAALSRLKVGLTDVSLGRFDGRVAYVIGGRDKDRKPLLFVGKDDYQPMRLVVPEGSALEDVRFVGWGSHVGGDWFPRAVEAWEGTTLQLRLTTEKATANPKIPDAVF
jgi:hypothetical protein